MNKNWRPLVIDAPLVMGTKEVEPTCLFDGQFNKCNNAEGCDCCKEYEEWLKAVTRDEKI